MSFNIHLDLPSLNTRTYALNQHVSVPTHVHGHWLNFFITKSTCINKAIFPPAGLSDHCYVIVDLWWQRQDLNKHFDE